MHAQKAECCSNTVHFTYILLLLTPIKSVCLMYTHTYMQKSSMYIKSIRTFKNPGRCGPPAGVRFI